MSIVGIDLGTTNSLIARLERGRLRVFTDASGSTLIPSVISVSDTGEKFVGSSAKEKMGDSRFSTVFSAKRFLGRGKEDLTAQETLESPFDLSASDAKSVRFTVGSQTLTPVEVGAEVLRELKRLAESQAQEKFSRAVVTVPAYFDDAQRQATKLAGELAGLEVVRILNEPTAACLAYGLDKKTKGNIAVFDLGGGTFDLSLLRVSDGVFEVLATAGDTRLGGDDFDAAIVSALRTEILAACGSDFLGSPANQALALRAAEGLKRELSHSSSARFCIQKEPTSTGSPTQTYFAKTVTREQLAAWCQPVLSRTEPLARQCLRDAGLTPEQISDVLLVGGSTRSPFVHSFVKSLFRREPLCSLNPDEVVAMGAAVQANILAGQMGDMLLLDVIPLSLGIETIGGVFNRIIHRNSTIPISASETFSTSVDGQVSVKLHVLQGERELAADNRSLAHFELKGLPPLPAGVPKIEVEFTVDANGILSARAIELRTGTTAAISVNPSYGLTDQEVENMLGQSFENAETDYEARFLRESRVEAEAVLNATEKSLKSGSTLVSDAERDKILASHTALKSALSGTDRKHIQTLTEALNQASLPLAERLLNRAVSEALKDKEIP